VAQALVGRNLLIVLDNCEHVLDAAAELVETILARTSTVSVVATSREALRVGGEHTWPVPSLDVRAGSASEAVSLFVERAQAVNRGFRFEEPGEVETVTEICRRLDGIALAIELAAARMVSMTAEEVRGRLDDRFRLLSGGRAAWRDTRPCARRCSGPTTCSTMTSGASWGAAPCSPTAATWRPSLPSTGATTSTRRSTCWTAWCGSPS
jgi:predicted ATPase